MTALEKRYVRKQIASLEFGMKYVNLAFLLILFVGVIMLFTVDVPMIGLGFVAIGLAGFILFSHFSEPMKFYLAPETVWLKGNINFKKITKGFAPYLGNKRLYCPGVFDMYLHEIADNNNPVTVEMAICHFSRKNDKGKFHVPLRIDNKLCVLDALNGYGLRFALLPSLLNVLNIVGGIVCFSILLIPVFELSSWFSGQWETVIFCLGLIPAIFLGFWVSFKILPDDLTIIKRRLCCEKND